MTQLNSVNLDWSKKLFILRGAYGYNGFTEKVGDNLYKVDSKSFQDAIENATEPLNPSKVSSLSANQLHVLKQSPSANWMIPLLTRMGDLGMIDLREGLYNKEHMKRLGSHAYTNAANAYRNSI